MIGNDNTKNIKKLRREAAILKNLMIVLHKVIIKKDIFSELSFNRVNITADGSYIIIFVHSNNGKEHAEKSIYSLTAYRKQIYYELCQILQYRYVPQLKFIYDEQQDKVIKINTILDQIASEY